MHLLDTYGINNYSLPSRFLNEISEVEIDKSGIIDDYNSSRENKTITLNDKELSQEKKECWNF